MDKGSLGSTPTLSTKRITTCQSQKCVPNKNQRAGKQYRFCQSEDEPEETAGARLKKKEKKKGGRGRRNLSEEQERYWGGDRRP